MKKLSVLGLALSVFAATSTYAADLSTPTAIEAVPVDTAGPIFDEVRFGTLLSVEDEHGAFISGMALFDPWGHDVAQGWDKLLRPRLHLGGTVSTAGEASQVYAGFSWTADLTDRLFLEVGFGGTVHDGDLSLSDSGDSPKLGCRALFHEYAAAGYSVTENWSILALIEHSSHAELCDGPNNGLSRAGLMASYRF